MNEALREHLEAVTNGIIAQAVSSDVSEAEVVPELAAGAGEEPG